MKFKKLIIPNFIFADELGKFQFHDVSVLVDANSEITPSSFNQETDDFSISSFEIERMNREAAQRFFNEKYNQILRGKYTLTSKEINGIRLFLRVNGTELGKLICLDKGTISKILNGKHQIQQEGMLLLMERMKSELDTPGYTSTILEKLNEQVVSPMLEFNIPPLLIAEWFIRKFVELEEGITNLKMQKLLYYAQGIGAARFNCKLIPEDFEAWAHGPVVPSVYHNYKTSGSSALSINPGADLTLLSKNTTVIKILEETLNSYGKYTAWVLRDKTHCESPWLETKQNQVIEFSLIQEFFKSSL